MAWRARADAARCGCGHSSGRIGPSGGAAGAAARGAGAGDFPLVGGFHRRPVEIRPRFHEFACLRPALLSLRRGAGGVLHVRLSPAGADGGAWPPRHHRPVRVHLACGRKAASHPPSPPAIRGLRSRAAVAGRLAAERAQCGFLQRTQFRALLFPDVVFRPAAALFLQRPDRSGAQALHHAHPRRRHHLQAAGPGAGHRDDAE